MSYMTINTFMEPKSRLLLENFRDSKMKFIISYFSKLLLNRPVLMLIIHFVPNPTRPTCHRGQGKAGSFSSLNGNNKQKSEHIYLEVATE